MNLPREGSRTIREGIIVSEPMDWCKSPSAIVPYKIYTHCQVEGADNADSVRQTDERSHVKGSKILQCYGDEPGVGGSVISGTHNAECEPKTWSSTMRAEGRNMVRHDDKWWMNHRNTWGKLTYIKDAKKYDTKEAKDVKPRMQWAFLPARAPARTPWPAPIRWPRFEVRAATDHVESFASYSAAARWLRYSVEVKAANAFWIACLEVGGCSRRGGAEERLQLCEGLLILSLSKDRSG